MSDPTDFRVRSIFGATTRRGLVELRFGVEELLVTPARARELATFMLEAATAAEGDETLMRVLDRARMSPRRAGQILMAMRIERQALERTARAEARKAVAEDQYDDDRVD